jgi:hypothetical protein
MWFNKKDLTIKPIISISNLHGYTLPHAGTSYSGEIISHTLRFRPTKKVNKIIILYYPASDSPDINESNISYYHEYYVPWKSLDYILGNSNNGSPKIIYEGYNINDIFTKKIDINQIKQSFTLDDTLIVVSSDFSHFLPFKKGISLENKAAHSLMFRELNNSPYINIVDDVKTYRILYKIIPDKLQLQWIGRTRSPGEKGVGYLSFLLREIHIPDITRPTTLPDGIFITAFDKNMNSRECLGNWYNGTNTSVKKWSLANENELRDKVIRLAGTTSRLTSGSNIQVPVSNYTVTYLYKDKNKEKSSMNNFIRGYHGILHNAFYLPEVFLENTFNNGNWIKDTDTTWQSGNTFNLDETFRQLNIKAGITKNNKTLKKIRNNYKYMYTKKNNSKNNSKNNNKNNSYTLYSSNVMHYKITFF